MSKKALVVDNDYFFVEFLSEILIEKGFDVVKTYDGKEAMAVLETDSVDLMFADMVMPKIDGWQLIRYVRKRFSDAPFPVVAVSGTIVEQIDELEQIGADYYIIKGPLEKMKAQILRFLDDLETRNGKPRNELQIYDPGDIYPRRESAELIESLQFQKAIFESLGFGLIVVDQDGKIMLVNELALRIFNCRPEGIFNHPVPSILPAGGQRRLVGTMRRVVEDPALQGLSCSVAGKDGEVKLTVSVLRVEGKRVGWVIAAEESTI